MECEEVKELLSEYIGRALDEKVQQHVKKHLSKCKDCSKEHRSLRTYFRAMGSLREVEVPQDFLLEVRKRIEQRRIFKRIMRKVFVPVRVKLPMELVGAAVAAVLVIYIHNTMQPVGRVAVTSQPVGRVAVISPPEISKKVEEKVLPDKVELFAL